MPDLVLPARDCPPNLGDYRETYAKFSLEVPERYNPVLHIVEGWAAEAPDAEAVVSIDGEGRLVSVLTAAQLAAVSRRAARALLAAGVVKGDRVLIMLPRVPAFYEAMLGAIRIGAVPMPAPGMLTSGDLAYRIGHAQATAVITDPAGAVKVDAAEGADGLRQRFCWTATEGTSEGEDALPSGWTPWAAALTDAGDGETPEDPTSAEDPLLIYFTSGTVAYPKMVLHAQRYGLGHVVTARYWHDLRPGDRHWTVSDSGWAKAAWGGLFGQWHERATVVQVALGRPQTSTILGIIQDHRLTSFCAPPTLYRLLVQGDFTTFDLSHLRHCTSAGEPLNPGVIARWRELTGLTVYDGYGQTETVNVVANFRGTEVKPGSMGRPTPGHDVRIVDDEGHEVPDGTVANVALVAEPRPIGLFAEYYRDAEATSACRRGRYYLTGDKAARDADGYLWFEGRSDDVITSSAYRIGPFEVESALVTHDAVVEAAVVGKDDPERTQLVTAFVVLAAGYQPSPELARQLQDHVKSVTAPYKYPRLVYFVAELPKTVSGKIRRSQIRATLNAGGYGEAASG
jgi:acyl-coenzyme A synthetase/AMP-(fatty) acid ligase